MVGKRIQYGNMAEITGIVSVRGLVGDKYSMVTWQKLRDFFFNIWNDGRRVQYGNVA